MSPKRLTRKEIKEDKIQDALVQVYDGLAQNVKIWVGLALVVAAVAAALFAWQIFSSGRSDAIQQSFADALEIYHAPLSSEVSADGEKPKYQFETAEERNRKALEAFSQLTEDYSGSNVGDFGRYYTALIQHDLGQSDQAKTTLESLIAASPEPEIAALARNYLAFLYQSAGENEQAISVWNALLETSPERFPIDGILANLAEAYEASGDKEEALKQYRRLVAEFPQNSNARKFQSKIDFLEAELEAAGKTPPPVQEPESKESGA